MPGVYALLLDEDVALSPGAETEEYVVHITEATMAPVTRTVEIFKPNVIDGSVEGTGQTTTVFDTNLTSTTDNNYAGMFLRFKGDTPTVALRNQTKKIISYDGTAVVGQITLAEALTTAPAAGDTFEIF